MAYKTGDMVRVSIDNENYEGIVMPSSSEKVLALKLKNGYNLNFEITKDVKVKVIAEAKPEKKLEIKVPKSDLPSVTLVSTGGTITSKVDYKTGAVFPLEKPEELILSIPELVDTVNIKKITQPFAVLSEDMTPAEWSIIAKEVADALNSKDTGVIVTHGTDTLHFTASALSFMLQNLSKPVALVGGQRSSDRGSFDGALNLIAAGHYVKSNIAEVAVVMHGEEADTFCFANRGTKTRKFHTTRRDTFRPINELPLAKISKEGKIEILNKNFKARTNNKVTVNTDFERKIALVKYYPGASPEIIDYYLDKKYKGLIIEATGLGHVSTQSLNKKDSWLPAIQEAVKKKMFIGFAPQCIYGTLDPFVYANARILQEAGVTYLGDMLPDTAYVKLGCMIPRAGSREELIKLMTTNIAGELNNKIPAQAFLY